MSTQTFPTQAALERVLVERTCTHLPEYTPRLARERVRDFLAMLCASRAPGALYPCAAGTVYIEYVPALDHRREPAEAVQGQNLPARSRLPQQPPGGV